MYLQLNNYLNEAIHMGAYKKGRSLNNQQRYGKIRSGVQHTSWHAMMLEHELARHKQTLTKDIEF